MPKRGWSRVIYQVYKAYVRPSLGNSPPVVVRHRSKFRLSGVSLRPSRRLSFGTRSVLPVQAYFSVCSCTSHTARLPESHKLKCYATWEFPKNQGP